MPKRTADACTNQSLKNTHSFRPHAHNTTTQNQLHSFLRAGIRPNTTSSQFIAVISHPDIQRGSLLPVDVGIDASQSFYKGFGVHDADTINTVVFANCVASIDEGGPTAISHLGILIVLRVQRKKREG
jgi:hypothetical protein